MRPTRPRAAPAPTPKTIMAEIPTPEQVALVRRRYVEGAPVERDLRRNRHHRLDIALSLPRRRLSRRLRHQARADRRGAAPACASAGRNGSRTALVARMWRTAERQVEEIEERLEGRRARARRAREQRPHARHRGQDAARACGVRRGHEAARQARRPNDDNDDDRAPETSTSSVESLRDALKRLSQPGRRRSVLASLNERRLDTLQRRLGRLRAPASGAAAGRLDHLADARRPRRRQDPRRRRMGAGAREPASAGRRARSR